MSYRPTFVADNFLRDIGEVVDSYVVHALEALVMQDVDSYVVHALEALVMQDLNYLHAHPDSPFCPIDDGEALGLQRVEDETWRDVGAILVDARANACDLTAWRAAELIRVGALVRVVLRRVRAEGGPLGLQTGVEFVAYPMGGVSNKVRRRIQRLLARRKRGEAFAEIVPGVPTIQEWST